MNIKKHKKKLDYDKEYYENGLVAGKSCYLNYRWLPELTFRMVFHMIRELDIKTNDKILDFGCAKGYIVKAFRFFDIECYGCDISEYAINNIDPEVIKFCKENNTDIMIPFNDMHFDWIICKDVLEHLEESEIDHFLQEASQKTKKSFIVVPLGENDKFIVPEYEKDITHKLAKNMDWWSKKFEDNSWIIEDKTYTFKRLKDNWTDKYPKSNGFFTLRKK